MMKYVIVKHFGTDAMLFWRGYVIDGWTANQDLAATYDHATAQALVAMARASGANTVFMILQVTK